MHLSRLTLNPRSKAARRDAANPYEMHSTLARVLDPETGFLWRLEDAVLLVQTRECPDWGRLEPDYLARPSEGKAVNLNSLASLERPLRFRLRANPTVTKWDETANKRKRHGIHDVEAQLEWLSRQGERGGFAVLGAMVSQSERLRCYKRDGAAPITLTTATFDGHLRVHDPEVFTETLETGLGHSRALGLGLLSVGVQR
jgi:CRISPR system Cascade subunit CasE